jgi:hypothetical protein
MRRTITRFAAAFLVAMVVTLAQAVEPAPRDELDLNLHTLAFIVGMSLLGGLVSWIAKVKAGVVPGWSLMHLIGELCTSAFAGFLCFLLCDAIGVSLKVTIGLVGVAGHMGTRAINAFEAFAEKKWGVLAGPTGTKRR